MHCACICTAIAPRTMSLFMTAMFPTVFIGRYADFIQNLLSYLVISRHRTSLPPAIMADPVSIISATASVAGIITVLTKSISMVTDLTVQWKESDLVFVSLKARLQLLVAALGKIQQWVDSTMPEEAHHQLTMDLDSVILCTKMLATKLEDTLGALQQNLLVDGTLGSSGKARLILQRKGLQTIEQMLDRQVTALTLLLSACTR